jgi:hypothetical protein
MVVWPVLSTGGDNHCNCTYTLYMYPLKVPSSFWRVAHLRELGHRNKGTLNSWWQFSCFGGYGVCFWCDTPLLRTGIWALDLCGNRSEGAKPRSTALGGMGSMPIMSWLPNHEFMVLPGGEPVLVRRVEKIVLYYVPIGAWLGGT